MEKERTWVNFIFIRFGLLLKKEFLSLLWCSKKKTCITRIKNCYSVKESSIFQTFLLRKQLFSLESVLGVSVPFKWNNELGQHIKSLKVQTTNLMLTYSPCSRNYWTEISVSCWYKTSITDFSALGINICVCLVLSWCLRPTYC